MIADAGLAWPFSAWFAIIAVVSLVGAVRARHWPDRASYVAHVVMGGAMAIMPWPWSTAIPSLVWIVVFGAAALGYAWLAIANPGVAVGPGAGHHARRLVAWYHVAMMLGMVWMSVLMGLLENAGMAAMAPVDLGAPGATMPGHATGEPPISGLVDVPPLWHLPAWAIGLTIVFAAMFAIATVWFLVQLRTAARGGRHDALPARGELVLSAAMATGMCVAYFLMA